MTTENDKQNKDNLMNQQDVCKDKNDNDNNDITNNNNTECSSITKGVNGGIVTSSAALITSIGNMNLRSRTQQQQQITTADGFGTLKHNNVEVEIKILSPSLVRKKVKRHGNNTNSISSTTMKISEEILQKVVENEQIKEEIDLQDRKVEIDVGQANMKVEKSLHVADEGLQKPDNIENNGNMPKTIEAVELITNRTIKSNIREGRVPKREQEMQSETTSCMNSRLIKSEPLPTNHSLGIDSIANAFEETSRPLASFAAGEPSTSLQSNMVSTAKLSPDLSTTETTTSLFDNNKCMTTSINHNITNAPPLKRRPYRRTKRPIGYNDRSSVTVVNTVPGRKHSISNVPLNVSDAILQESNDLMAAASEAQQLGRYKMASTYLRFLHARLVGLGKRFDNKRLKTQVLDRTTSFGSNSYKIRAQDINNDDREHDNNDEVDAVEEHKGDQSDKGLIGKRKFDAINQIDQDDGNPNDDANDDTHKEEIASSNDKISNNNEKDAVATLAKLFPNIPIDKTMYEYLKKAAAELHAARSVGVDSDADAANATTTVPVPFATTRVSSTGGTLGPHITLQASDIAPTLSTNTITRIAWTEHEKQTIQNAVASGERNPRRIAGLIPNRTEQQVKAYLHNQTELARVEADLVFLPQSASTGTTTVVLSKGDDDVTTKQISNQGTFLPASYGKDPSRAADTIGNGISNRKVTLPFAEGVQESMGEISAKKKTERGVKKDSSSKSPNMDLSSSNNNFLFKTTDQTDSNSTNINSKKKEVVSHDMGYLEQLPQQQQQEASITPVKRKGGRGKKPETAAINTVPNAICNARALLQGTLLNSSSSSSLS
jgi:Myb-like DNA-binding domain